MKRNLKGNTWDENFNVILSVFSLRFQSMVSNKCNVEGDEEGGDSRTPPVDRSASSPASVGVDRSISAINDVDDAESWAKYTNFQIL